MSDNTVSLRELGFLGAFPGREYRVFAQGGEVKAGKLTLQVAGLRLLTDDAMDAANDQGLRFDVAFDDAHPDFVLLETTGSADAVEKLARRIVHLGYHLLVDVPADPEAPYDLTRAGEGLETLPDFITDEELALVLRRGVQAIQRYRLDGGLPFIPGRPPVIQKSDLFEWLRQFRTIRPVNSHWTKEYRTIVPYGKGVDDTDGKLVSEARERALRMKLKPVRRPRPKLPT